MFSRTSIVAAAAALTLFAGSAGAQTTFEAPKAIDLDFDGIALDFGAHFTQTFQMLDHSNGSLTAAPLGDIGAGFNLATANFDIAAQMAPGIRVVLENYVSSRHHNEFWAKGGYLQLDQSPIEWLPLQVAMAMTTIKVGHYEVNYGDAHFRRTDNGNSIRNPFVENLIFDAFTTEIGGEAIVRVGSLLGVVGVTSGQNKGDVKAPDDRSWAFITKLGADHRFGESLRGRLTLSTYQNDDAGRATLYAGDRAGSAYWGVMDDAEQGDFRNGRLNPNFTEEISALMLSTYLEAGDFELFGVVERAEGRTSSETELRELGQYAVDLVYRLLDDQLYVGVRYNDATGELYTVGDEQSSTRTALAGGWFLTPSVLLKAEWVKQTFDGFADDHILHDGQFDGVVLQGAVSF